MPGSPYTDLDRPPLNARALERALVVPGGLWRRIDIREETGSTNADVAAAARTGVPEGLVVVAEQQQAGRGRRDRTWVSPPRAGLTLSVLLRPGPSVPQRHWGWLSLLAGVALRETVERRAELPARLKWPNDLLLGYGADEAKAAGILAEMVDDAVIVGIGLNVTTRASELPPAIGTPATATPATATPAAETPATATPAIGTSTAGTPAAGLPGAGTPAAGLPGTGLPATSLQLAGAKVTDRDPLLRDLLRGMAAWYGGWREAGGDAEMCGLLAAYREGCTTIGREVRVQVPGGADLIGTAATVDNDGQLVIRTVDGSQKHVSAGDVLHVR